MPALDPAALRTQLKSGTLAPLYLFVGEDLKLIDRMVDGVEAVIDPADRPFAVERIYAGEEGGAPVDIAAAARVYPMLGDRRIVFVMRAERLLKPKRASKSADADLDAEDADAEGSVDAVPLEEYIAAPSPSTVVVFVATEIDKSRRLTKRLMDKAQFVVFGGLAAIPDKPKPGEVRLEATNLIKAELLRAGRVMDPAAMNLLIDRCGADIGKLRGDLERLLLYTEDKPRISIEDVSEIASVETAVDDWALVNAIGDGDPSRALREAASRLERGDSPHAMLGQLRWWVSTRLAEGAPGRVPAALDALLRTDLALKSSGGDDRVLVERLVVELTGSPIPRRGGWR